MNQESESSSAPSESISAPSASDSSTGSKKPRKEYEWTPKRKEAFEKMRKGLEEKVSLTKRIKEEKRRAEKEAIKAKVKEIMNSKRGKVSIPDETDSSDASSEEEEPKARKKSTKEKKAIAKEKEKEAKKSSKRKPKEIVSSEESNSVSEEESSDEEVIPARERDQFSSKQHQYYQKDKVERGKAVKVAQFVNPLDRFILL
jgi:hypothetical protein